MSTDWGQGHDEPEPPRTPTLADARTRTDAPMRDERPEPPADNNVLTSIIKTLEGELKVKNEQLASQAHTINTLLERDKETNVLFQGLQGMLTTFLGLASGNSDIAARLNLPRQKPSEPDDRPRL